jgi:hypothetical protein
VLAVFLTQARHRATPAAKAAAPTTRPAASQPVASGRN